MTATPDDIQRARDGHRRYADTRRGDWLALSDEGYEAILAAVLPAYTTRRDQELAMFLTDHGFAEAGEVIRKTAGLPVFAPDEDDAAALGVTPTEPTETP